MSALGGVLMFGGARVEREALAALGARLERLGPDGGGDAHAGAVAMTYRAFHTNAESRRERQPYCRGHELMLCWDGRLDNREELLAQVRDELRGDDTDAAIALAAYQRWRRDGLAKLVGDFALALWDRRDRAVWLARDCAGTRTLFYHLDGTRVLWSTDLGALLDVSGVPIEVNDEYVAGFLTRGPEPGVTPYVGIHAVKPAHVVRIGQDGLVSEQRFWALDARREIRYRTDAEYEEHFRTLFREAVRVRLRSDRPVFAELSGGLDSSSIVCMADEVRASCGGASPLLHTISYVCDESPSSNEARFIKTVEDHRGAHSHYVYESRHPYLMPLAEAPPVRTPNFFFALSGFETEIQSVLAGYGARVLLSGRGGDQMLHSTNEPSPELADRLWYGDLIGLHRRLVLWSRTIHRPYFNLFWHKAVAEAVPPRVKHWVIRRGHPVEAWLDPGFVMRARVGERMRRPEVIEATTRPSARDQVAGFVSVVRLIANGERQELGGRDITYPYLHRPLAEFLLAIPFQQLVRPGESRSLMRRALRHMVPEAILRRRGKGNATEVACRSVARQAPRLLALFDDPLVAQRHYVRADAIRQAVVAAKSGVQPHSPWLLRITVLELWLRELNRTLRLTPKRVNTTVGPAIVATL